VFEFRKHNRVVDATLLCTPGIIETRSGVLFMKSVLSGKSRDMLRAYKTVQREAKLMKPFLLAMLFGLLLVAVVFGALIEYKFLVR
jgi:hypothetical protein